MPPIRDARGRFVKVSDTLTPGLQRFPGQLESGLRAIIEYYADVAEGQAREQAPWVDRTGNARAGLNAQGISTPDRHVIVVYHTMPYGVWLEVRWSGQYAVLVPTIESVGPKVMDAVRNLIARL